MFYGPEEPYPGYRDGLINWDLACEKLHCTYGELHGWVQSGEIPVVVIGNAVKRFRTGDLEDFVNRDVTAHMKRFTDRQAVIKACEEE